RDDLPTAVAPAFLDQPLELGLGDARLVEADGHRVAQVVGLDVMHPRLPAEERLQCRPGAPAQETACFQNYLFHRSVPMRCGIGRGMAPRKVLVTPSAGSVFAIEAAPLGSSPVSARMQFTVSGITMASSCTKRATGGEWRRSVARYTTDMAPRPIS